MKLTPTMLDDIVAEVRTIIEDAGTLLLDGLNRPKQITRKGMVDLVTEYDERAEALIRSRLDNAFPRFGVLAEEHGHSGPPKAEAIWIVDPLDGTTNFAHGHPLFAVSIGLQANGQLVAGVITLPAMGLTMWAREGGGAFCNGEPMTVSVTPTLNESLLSTGFPYDRRTARDDNLREHAAFVKRTQGIRRCGAATADLAMVAKGVYDGFWEPRLHAWDLAAGVVLVREAGGEVTDYAGQALDIFSGWVVASNKIIHRRMLEVIGQARADL